MKSAIHFWFGRSAANCRSLWPRSWCDSFCALCAQSSATRRSSPSPRCPRRCRIGSCYRRCRWRPSGAATDRWRIGCRDPSDASEHPACRAGRQPSAGRLQPVALSCWRDRPADHPAPKTQLQNSSSVLTAAPGKWSGPRGWRAASFRIRHPGKRAAPVASAVSRLPKAGR